MAKIAVELRIGVIGGNGAIHQFQRGVGVTDVKCQYAHPMQSLGMIWLFCQHLAIERFGLLKPAGLVMLDRQVDGVLVRGVTHESDPLSARTTRSTSCGMHVPCLG